MRDLDLSVFVTPVPSVVVQSEATKFYIVSEANTEYVDLPEALSHRLEGSVI